MLFEMAQRSAAIAQPRSNQTIVGVLFERVGDPTRSASNRENRGWNRARETEHSHADGEIEVEVGTQMFALPYRGFDFERGLEQTLAAMLRDRLRNFLQQHSARIAFGINRMTEARRQTVLAGKRGETFVHAREIG